MREEKELKEWKMGGKEEKRNGIGWRNGDDDWEEWGDERKIDRI